MTYKNNIASNKEFPQLKTDTKTFLQSQFITLSTDFQDKRYNQ